MSAEPNLDLVLVVSLGQVTIQWLEEFRRPWVALGLVPSTIRPSRCFLDGLDVKPSRSTTEREQEYKGARIMADVAVAPIGWERALMAAEKVKERLRRATRALDAAGVRYAVVGGNAVAEWVARVDEDAVRNTKDVDILVRRADLPAVKAALESVGFVYHHVLDVDLFIDGPQGRPSAGVHLLYAGEPVKPGDLASPNIDESERATEFQVVSLESIVRMKLIAWRDKDRTHLRDLIGVGQIDATWPARFPPPLGDRLQQLLDDPNG